MVATEVFSSPVRLSQTWTVEMDVTVCVTVTVRAGEHAVASTAAVSLVTGSSDVPVTPVGFRPIVELSPSRAVVVVMREPGAESSDDAGFGTDVVLGKELIASTE